MRILLLTVLILPLFGQEPPPPPPGGGQRRPPPEPKNLKVLKVPPTELIPLMRAYSASLGVRCDHCHVQGNFAADEKPQKETARKMIDMTEHLNTMLGEGKVHVTCYTCHRGDVEPKTLAPAPPPGQGPPAGARPPQQ